MVSGEAMPYEKGRGLQITILDSTKKILLLQVVPVNEDATFSLTVSDTSKWKKDNTVLAQYGTTDVEVGTASFSFDPTKMADVDGADKVKEKAKKVDTKKDAKKKAKKPSKSSTKKK